VISPYVKPGSVFSDLVDSTSILQLFADRFTPGRAYSPAVAARQKYFKPLSRILDNPPTTTKPKPIPAPLDQLLSGSPAVALDTGEATPTAQALIRASSAMAKLHPDQIRRAKTGAA
jgi:phospholipase C